MTDTPETIRRQALLVMEKYGLTDPSPGPEPQLPDPEFADVLAAVVELRQVVSDTIAADRAQSEQVLGALRSTFPTVYATVTAQLGQLVESVVAGVDEELVALEQLIDGRLAPHTEVPAKLEAERDLERTRRDRLEEIAAEVTELLEPDGWSGEAAEGYRRAGRVQASALAELAGVQHSSANALDRSALLNRAAFFHTTEAVSFTSAQIRALHPGDATALFVRTRTIERHLQTLRGKIAHELDAIADGVPATSLAEQLDGLLGAPAVLTSTGWPTGGAACETPPAPTRHVVPPLD